MAVNQYALCFQLLWAGRSGACINGAGANGAGRMVQVEWRRSNGAGRMAQVGWRRCEKMLGTCAAIEMQISDYAVFIINVWRRSNGAGRMA